MPPPFMPPPFYHNKHILVIQPLVGIGDMIWHKPWIDHLCQHAPSRTKVTLVAKPTSKAEFLFHDMRDRLTILPLERFAHKRVAPGGVGPRGVGHKRVGRHDGVVGFWRMVSDFRAVQADMVIILHHSPRYARASFLSRIPHRIGYGGQKFGFNYLNAGPPLTKPQHRLDAIAKIDLFARCHGFGLENPVWRLPVPAQGQREADRFLTRVKLRTASGRLAPFLAIGIGAMHVERQWRAQNFASLMRLLQTHRPDLASVMIAGPDELALADRINHALIAAGGQPVAIAHTRLDIAYGVMARSVGYVGNDTGLLNMAACLPHPVLGFYSQTKPLTYKDNLKSLSLFAPHEYGQKGLIHRIQPEHVMHAINQIWLPN